MSSPSKAKRKLRDGVDDLASMWSSVMETHKSGASSQQSTPGTMERLLGVLPHLVAFVFTTYVVWMARPGSSRFYILRINNYGVFITGLFSWHPTLMCLSVSEYVQLFTHHLQFL